MRIHNWTKGMGLLLFVAALPVGGMGCGDDSPKPPAWNVGEVLAFKGKGVLAEVQAPYGPVKILRVQGTHYEMGYQYGYLMAEYLHEAWDTVFLPLLGEEFDMDPDLAIDLFNGLADQAWNHVLPYMPQDFLDEIDGAVEGARDAGDPDPEFLGDMLRRTMMLLDTSQADAFGSDIGPMTRFFTKGYSEGYAEFFQIAAADVDRESMEQQLAMDGIYAPKPYRDRVMHLFGVPTCSFFAVWGDHTEDGGQLASRVLDFTADIGLGTIPLITVFVPDGGAAHISVGYVGMLSLLAGMNEYGVAISAVGSSSSLDRLKTESISAKAREVLEDAHNLDDGLPLLTGSAEDGTVRAPSVGTVAMLAWGDPEHAGAGAEAGATEFNGVYASLYRYGPAPTCGEESTLYEFDQAGDLAATYTHADDPMKANLEEDTYEIDGDGNIRTFLVDANQEFVYDATSGLLIDDPDGEPYRIGYPIPCAMYRADTAFNYMVRRYQTASNGPARDRDNTLAHLSGAYRNRYISQYHSIQAVRDGSAFEWEGVEVFPDNGGVERKIDVDTALDLIWVAADDNDNTFSVLYDTTNLVLYVAYESGTGESWTPAQDNEYLELRFSDLLPADRL